jgi:hypothetical protein
VAVDTPIAPYTPEVSGMAQTVGTLHDLLYLSCRMLQPSFPNHRFAPD